jgi:Na+/phosphate symporter
MNPIYVPLLSALAGALIGSLSSIATIVIQTRISDHRERLRQAATLALEEYKIHIANAAGAVMPFSSFLRHHIAIWEAIEQGDLTPERLKKIAADDEALDAAQFELEREWRAKRSSKRPDAQ